MPDSITTIGSYAFNNSIRIRHFTVPDGVKRIENYTFANNYNIDIIDLGHVQYIGKYALGKCGSIRTVVLPKELEVIDENAFANTVVYRLFFKGNKSEWDGIEIKSGNDTLSNIVYLYSETKPNVAGHYWHYVNGVITTWP